MGFAGACRAPLMGIITEPQMACTAAEIAVYIGLILQLTDEVIAFES
jgi:hypothetical protein